jgi:predicted phosphodiesterase
MRIGVISDVHANLEALSAVLTCTRHEVDAYLCLGDIVDYGANPNECVALLSDVPSVGAVRGNHDSAVLHRDVSRFRTRHGRHSVLWTAARLTTASVDFLERTSAWHCSDALGFAAFHGGPLDYEWQYLYPSTPPDVLDRTLAGIAQALVFVGHSHVPFRFRHGDWLIVNPGSVGQPRNGHSEAHYAVYDTASGDVALRRVAYDIHAAAGKIKDAGLDLFLARRLFLGI